MRTYGMRFDVNCSTLYLADLYHLATMGEDVADVLSRHREYVPADPAGSAASFGWL
jgi:hypothetical protein